MELRCSKGEDGSLFVVKTIDERQPLIGKTLCTIWSAGMHQISPGGGGGLIRNDNRLDQGLAFKCRLLQIRHSKTQLPFNRIHPIL